MIGEPLAGVRSVRVVDELGLWLWHRLMDGSCPCRMLLRTRAVVLHT